VTLRDVKLLTHGPNKASFGPSLRATVVIGLPVFTTSFAASSWCQESNARRGPIPVNKLFREVSAQGTQGKVSGTFPCLIEG
jgi:hypothetical protein